MCVLLKSLGIHGNSFLEHSQDLLVIDTRDIVDTQVADTVRRIDTLGEEQYTEFVTQRLERCTTPITHPLPKNKLLLFSRPPVKFQSKERAQLAALNSDCGLLSRLYISCQTRDGDINHFFAHENQAAPPALSSGGKLWFGVKADLLRCLESNLLENKSVPETDAVILDGAAVVQMLNPKTSRTFQEYGETVFVPYISAQLEVSTRVDLVRDVYLSASLKASTRQKRGNGMRKRVAPLTVMPMNWKNFLDVMKKKNRVVFLPGQRSR